MRIEFNEYGRMVDGLGDEDVPGWLAPYVRELVALARSTAFLEARKGEGALAPSRQPARAALVARLGETAAVARVASKMGADGAPLLGAALASFQGEFDDYCLTPPRPHSLADALLIVATFASGLKETDSAKGVFVKLVEKLQGPADR